MRWTLTAGALALVTFPVLVISALLGGLVATTPTNPAGSGGEVSQHARAEIPPDYLAWYLHWSRECPGLSWGVVAAIGKIETDHGRSQLPGVHSGTNDAGAAGPMQFGIRGKAGNTWGAYGRDGDQPPDGRADVYHAPDAIRAAVGYLCAHGAPTQLRQAVFAYNRSNAYVDAVLALGARYAAAPAATTDASGLLDNPRVTLTPQARTDLEAGIIDARVITILTTIAQHYPITVSVLKTGHSPYVAGTRTYSEHYFGRGADISMIGGQPVSARNTAAHEVTVWLESLTGSLRPAEVGSPFPEFEPKPGHFSDAGHADHLHIAYTQSIAARSS